MLRGAIFPLRFDVLVVQIDDRFFLHLCALVYWADALASGIVIEGWWQAECAYGRLVGLVLSQRRGNFQVAH